MNVDDMPLPSEVFKESERLEELIYELITQQSRDFIAKFTNDAFQPFCDEYGLSFCPPDMFFAGRQFVSIGNDRIPKPNRPVDAESDDWWFPLGSDQLRMRNLLNTPFGLSGSTLAWFLAKYEPARAVVEKK